MDSWRWWCFRFVLFLKNFLWIRNFVLLYLLSIFFDIIFNFLKNAPILQFFKFSSYKNFESLSSTSESESFIQHTFECFDNKIYKIFFCFWCVSRIEYGNDGNRKSHFSAHSQNATAVLELRKFLKKPKILKFSTPRVKVFLLFSVSHLLVTPPHQIVSNYYGKKKILDNHFCVVRRRKMDKFKCSNWWWLWNKMKKVKYYQEIYQNYTD